MAGSHKRTSYNFHTAAIQACKACSRQPWVQLCHIPSVIQQSKRCKDMVHQCTGACSLSVLWLHDCIILSTHRAEAHTGCQGVQWLVTERNSCTGRPSPLCNPLLRSPPPHCRLLTKTAEVAAPLPKEGGSLASRQGADVEEAQAQPRRLTRSWRSKRAGAADACGGEDLGVQWRWALAAEQV